MSTFIRPFSIAAAIVMSAGTAAAQDKPSGLLNSVEVRQLVARGQPSDHARLGVHFRALGDRYTAEAKRHLSMSQGFAGNANRSLGTSMSGHCKRLADLNTQSAATVRELAALHENQSRGVASAPPQNPSGFEAGAGASKPTDAELNGLAAKASTPTDHVVLENYFAALAKRYTADADEHAAMARATSGASRAPQAASHHDKLAALARDSAKAASEAADMHKRHTAEAR